MYWDAVSAEEIASRDDAFWLSHPLIRRYVNQAVSASSEQWPLDWLASLMAERMPLSEVTTIGCGTGALERDLVSRGLANRAVGIDVAERAIGLARDLAAQQGLSDRVSYQIMDAWVYLEQMEENSLANIFFHGALHHFDRMDELLRLVRSRLEPGGLLYLDEYIGPSMRQWNALRLVVPNLAYYLLPSEVRRPRLIRAPVNPEDPSEMVCSSEIGPTVKSLFSILEYRSYGGNLLALIYPNLRRAGGTESLALERAVARLIRFERRLLRVGAPFVRSHHAVIVATKL